MSREASYDFGLVSAFAMYQKKPSVNGKSKKRIKKKEILHQLNSPQMKQNQKLSKKQKRVPNTKLKINGQEKGLRKVSIVKNSITFNHESSSSREILNDSPYSDDPVVEVKKKKIRKVSSLKDSTSFNHDSFSSTEILNNSSNEDPVLEAVSLFKWMLNPITPENFFKTYWEQKTLHIKRSNENYYAHILSSSALDKIIRNNHLNYTQNVDVVSYENGVKEVHNPEGRATASALWDYYSNGCSIRVLNPHTYNHKVHLLLVTLQEYFGTMVGANVYLTPPGSQGFAPHYDDIEAFVVQLEGRKHWKLYHPKKSDVLSRFSSANLKHDDIGEPFMELTLNAGEILYFPRGTIHEGRTDGDAHSLHITISVYQRTAYADLLENLLPTALQKAAENDIEFRKGLPLNYLKHVGIAPGSGNSEIKKMIGVKVKNLIHSLVDYIDVDLAADLLGKKLIHDSMPPVLSSGEEKRCSKLDGPYLVKGQVKNMVEIDLDSRIRLLRYYCLRVVSEPNVTPKLYYSTENANFYHGKEEQWLELEPAMIPAIQMLQNTYPRYVEVEKLPMEDEILKMQLIADLWEHGLIVTETPLIPIDDD